MISYPTFCRLRQLCDQDGLNLSQIAAELRLHRQTVATWIDRKEYRQRATPRPWISKLDPFKGTIKQLLSRFDYTSSQIHSRIREEGYSGGYSILGAYPVRPPQRLPFLRWRPQRTHRGQLQGRRAPTPARTAADLQSPLPRLRPSPRLPAPGLQSAFAQ